ncbi:MAG: hypothetical protein M0Q13_04545 [Methanothrix sp.]|nr:hypothetical protein [Methanothrix sp.]
MTRAENISKRLPHFYRQWDRESQISLLTSAAGQCMDESEKELISILHAHWVDKASRYDLEKLGALFRIQRTEGEADLDYRNRIKTAILRYQGGGTVSAIQASVRIALRLPQDHPVEIKENPEVLWKKNYTVRSGTKWQEDARSINDSTLDITLSVDTENAKITDPTFKNITTGDSITFQGDVSYGEVLEICGDKATLNGEDQSSRLSISGSLRLPRGVSQWQYTEFVGGNQGAFDLTLFDKSVFVVDITSSITLEWAASQPATFELRLPKETLTKAGVKAKEVQEILDSVKASGVKAELKLV